MGPAFSLYLLPDEVPQFLKRCHLTCERTIRDLFASFNFRIVNPLFWKYGQCRSKSKTFNFWKLDWNFEIWTPRAPFSVNHIFVTYRISVGGNIHGPCGRKTTRYQLLAHVRPFLLYFCKIVTFTCGIIYRQDT